MTTATNAQEIINAFADGDYEARDGRYYSAIRVAVREKREAMQKANAKLAHAVADAREAGDSWDMIASALGCSRQAAHERFGPKGKYANLT
ncbi:hypothetical protein [Tsukamurella spumae]|uniref:Uncharacterized protein n=1 Tax=Tsukamurella spumae TaxID=44753 RepID=A0A846X3K7_9ACTN|nr:hypothetical protein [Tsukamurella spumae]NKY19733.1 hypothetical protein [Tsukamurella spumae]